MVATSVTDCAVETEIEVPPLAVRAVCVGPGVTVTVFVAEVLGL